MANELMALVRQVPAAAAEDDYRSFCAALETSARGRAFLAEYARRNRQADTEVLLAALARLEGRLRADGGALARLRDELRGLLVAIRLARPEIDATKDPAKAPVNEQSKAEKLGTLLDLMERRIEGMVDDSPVPLAAPGVLEPTAARAHLAVVPPVAPVQRQEKVEPLVQARAAALMPEVTVFGSAPPPVVSPPAAAFGGAGTLVCGEGLVVGVVVEWQSDRLIAATPLPNPPPQGGRENEKAATAAPKSQPSVNPLAAIMALSAEERIALFT